MKKFAFLIFASMLLISSLAFVSCKEHEHTFTEWEIHKEATCESTGIKYRECIECEHTESDIIDLKEHTEAILPRIEPTCTQKGLTEGKYCSVCDKILTHQEEIKATGHTLVKDEAVAPTCTASGLTEGEHCSVCKAVTVKQTPIDKVAHELGEWETGRVGTCATIGTEERKCANCPYNEVRDTTFAPHKLGAWVEAIAPTETEDGVAGHRTCSVCAKSFNINGVYLKSTTLVKEAKGLEVEFSSGNSCTIVGIGTYATHSTHLNIPSTINGYTVTRIGPDAFKGCTAITGVTFPNTLTSIGSYAFADCTSLYDINYPISLTSIREGVFSGCTSLENVTLNEGIQTIGSYTFEECTSLTEVVIPQSVTRINAQSFVNCKSLESIVLPEGIEVIDSDAFTGCRNLVIKVPFEKNQAPEGWKKGWYGDAQVEWGYSAENEESAQ